VLLLVPYAHDRLPYLPFLAVRCLVLVGYAVGVLALVDPERLAQFARRLSPLAPTPLEGNPRRTTRVP
jgi:hypothetical protein